MRKSRAKNTTTPAKPATRCAIYTRKSSEEGLDQEFNSLDAQREAAEAFIASQKVEGWTALPDRYDDGGYSGGSMERPALDRLIRDTRSGTRRAAKSDPDLPIGAGGRSSDRGGLAPIHPFIRMNG